MSFQSFLVLIHSILSSVSLSHLDILAKVRIGLKDKMHSVENFNAWTEEHIAVLWFRIWVIRKEGRLERHLSFVVVRYSGRRSWLTNVVLLTFFNSIQSNQSLLLHGVWCHLHLWAINHAILLAFSLRILRLFQVWFWDFNPIFLEADG